MHDMRTKKPNGEKRTCASPPKGSLDEKKEYLERIKGRGCVNCGEKDMRVLELHHIDPTTKKFNIGQYKNYSISSLRTEVAKCKVLCANCHKREHTEEKNTNGFFQEGR